MERVISRLAQPGRRMSRKPSITIWPEKVAVTVEFSPQHSNATPNKVGAMRRAEQRRDERMRLIELGDVDAYPPC